MPPIVIPFTSNDLGRILFNAHVSTSDSKSLKRVNFKLDYGSDFTTLSCEDLDILGYSYEYLKNCPAHEDGASLAADEVNVPVQYITNVSIKFGDRELQHCRVWRTLIMAKSEARLFSEAGAVKLGEISQNNDIYTAFLKFQGEKCLLCNIKIGLKQRIYGFCESNEPCQTRTSAVGFASLHSLQA